MSFNIPTVEALDVLADNMGLFSRTFKQFGLKVLSLITLIKEKMKDNRLKSTKQNITFSISTTFSQVNLANKFCLHVFQNITFEDK